MSGPAVGNRFEVLFEPFRGVVDELWSTLVSAIEGNARRLLLCSARTGDGTTTISSALAMGLAKYYQNETLLLEATGASPGLASYLDVLDQPGLAQCFRHEAVLDDVLIDPGIDLLRIAIWGSEAHAPMSRSNVTQLFDRAQRLAKLLIIDAGPLLDRPEGRLLLPNVDATVLIGCSRRSRQDDLEQVASILKAAPSEFLGSILNRYKREMPGR